MYCFFTSVYLRYIQELNEEEKQVWNAKAAEAMEAYKKELEEYNKSVAAAMGEAQQQ